MHRLTDILHRLAETVQQFAEQLGGVGLAIVAFFDSSFLSLPEVADLLVAAFTIREPSHWVYFAAMTTTGSVAGCYALYLVGLKGGDALLRRRFHERHIDLGLAWFQRYGAFAVIVPAVLPPPMPFKVFVLLSGVAGLSRPRFLAAVAIGRGVRYGGVALLARLYGERGVRFLQENVLNIVITLAAVGLVAAGWWFWRRPARRAARQAADPSVPVTPGSEDVE